MRAFRRLCSFALFLAVAASSLVGCRSRCDLVEAELRTRENQLYDLKGELFRLEAHNDALSREVKTLRGGSASSPEVASQTLTLKTIALGRSTGGLDDDGCPGDEALQVLVEPRDADGHTLKTPGTLIVQALEVTPEGLKKTLCAWQLSADALRRTWRDGLLTTGYSLVLPWKAWPETERVRVVARLTLNDGRGFEAEKDVTVRVAPVLHRKAAPGDGPELELPAPRPAEVLSARPVSYSPRKAPLTDAVELMRPVALPAMRRPEWGP